MANNMDMIQTRLALLSGKLKDIHAMMHGVGINYLPDSNVFSLFFYFKEPINKPLNVKIAAEVLASGMSDKELLEYIDTQIGHEKQEFFKAKMEIINYYLDKPSLLTVQKIIGQVEQQQQGGVSDLAKALPGVNTKVKCPACNKKGTVSEFSERTVWGQVQHLNDNHKWSRNAIADWTESLDVDLEFKEV